MLNQSSFGVWGIWKGTNDWQAQMKRRVEEICWAIYSRGQIKSVLPVRWGSIQMVISWLLHSVLTFQCLKIGWYGGFRAMLSRDGSNVIAAQWLCYLGLPDISTPCKWNIQSSYQDRVTSPVVVFFRSSLCFRDSWWWVYFCTIGWRRNQVDVWWKGLMLPVGGFRSDWKYHCMTIRARSFCVMPAVSIVIEQAERAFDKLWGF